MNKTSTVIGILGAAATGWGGASLGSQIGLSGSHYADLAIFAVGLIFLGQLPSIQNRERIRRLEAELDALRGKAAAPAS